MIPVIFIYKRHLHIQKPHYNHKIRDQFSIWPINIETKEIRIDRNTLLLPIEKKDSININRISCIVKVVTIKDFDLALSSNSIQEECYYFHKEDKKYSFDIFSLSLIEKNVFELHLEYTKNNYKIGIPKRSDIKICNLLRNNSIRFKMNGKHDQTMSSGKHRSFSEFDYIFEFSCEIDSIEFVKKDQLANDIMVPEYTKIIDMRKILY